jgi:hypothetical protein
LVFGEEKRVLLIENFDVIEIGESNYPIEAIIGFASVIDPDTVQRSPTIGSKDGIPREMVEATRGILKKDGVGSVILPAAKGNGIGLVRPASLSINQN